MSVTAVLAGAGAAALVAAIGGATPARRWPVRRPEPGRSASATVGLAATRVLERADPRRRARRRDAQLPDALDRLAATVRAGQAIGPAVVELATTAPEPLRSDLRPVVVALDQGAPVATALARWAEHPSASPDVRLVVAALTLGSRAGGEVARAIDRIAATVRERREVQAEVQALATQARTSAALLAVAPLAFSGLVTTIEPGAVAFLITTRLGLACLLLGLGLEALGAVWMRRITRSAA